MSEATAALMGDNGAAAAAAPAAAPAAPVTGGAQAPWYGQADEATAAYIQNKGWDSPIKAIESYRNLEKFAGGSKSLLELPGPDADETKLGEFYGKLGRPADPKEYGIKVPDGGDPALADWFTKTAHANGLTTKQAQGLFNKWQEMSGARMQEFEAQAKQESEKAIAELQREWGQGYEKQIAMGRNAVSALGFDQQKLTEFEARLGTAEMLRLFATLGSKMGEPSFEGVRSAASGFGTTPAEAQQQLNDLKTDKAFMEQYMAGNAEAVGKFKRLMEQAYGG